MHIASRGPTRSARALGARRTRAVSVLYYYSRDKVIAQHARLTVASTVACARSTRVRDKGVRTDRSASSSRSCQSEVHQDDAPVSLAHVLSLDVQCSRPAQARRIARQS